MEEEEGKRHSDEQLPSDHGSPHTSDSEEGNDTDASDASIPHSSLSTCIELLGMQRRSKCGYCKKPNGSKAYMVRAKKLACGDYQQLVDRGWRRSGKLLYLNDHSDSCCAYYSIRTKAMQVGLGRTEKRVLRRWRKRSAENTDRQVTEEENKDGFWAQVCGGMGAGLRVELEPAEFSQAKYRVFERYQKQVHNDEDCSPHGFRRFLCTSPLVSEGHLLGSFHQCHYMDDELIAVGVVDVLPLCVSAVYFFYDPSWAWLSPGTYGALREMALVHELHRHIDSLRYYYMGYYVPGCAKMEYKARWRPAELLDPLSFRWMPLEHCLACIARHPVFSSFDWAVQEDAVVRDAYDDVKREAAPALYEPLAQMEWSDVAPLKVWLDLNRFGQGYVDLSVGDLRGISVRIEQAVLQVVAAMGISLARRIKIIIV